VYNKELQSGSKLNDEFDRYFKRMISNLSIANKSKDRKMQIKHKDLCQISMKMIAQVSHKNYTKE